MNSPTLPGELKNRVLGTVSEDESLTALRVKGGILTAISAKRVEIKETLLDNVEISSSKLHGATFQDVVCQNCLMFGTDFDGSSLLRVSFEGGMFSGVAWSGASVIDVSFKAVKLNLANFRMSKLERVRFEDCELAEADFMGSKLKDVVFLNCDLRKTDFSNCQMKAVDLRGNDLSNLRGSTSLKGAWIDVTQLIQLSPRWAADIGIEVKE